MAHVSQLNIYRNATDDDFTPDTDEDSDFTVDVPFYEEEERRVGEEEKRAEGEESTLTGSETLTETAKSGRTVQRPKYLNAYV